MKTKTKIRSGGITLNHNGTLVRAPNVKVKTKIRSGGINLNHNGTLVRA